MSTLNKEPLNGRELLNLLFVAALFLMLGMVMAGIVWMFIVREPNRLVKLSLADYSPAAEPYHVQVREYSFWLVNTGAEISVFVDKTPDNHAPESCQFAWTPANNRFEDPCYGAKFTLDGHYLEGPAQRNLDRHPFTRQRDEIWVDPLSVSLGEPVLNPVECCQPIN